MRSVRMTYRGALHHVINRGKKGLEILSGNRNKLALLNLLKDNVPKYKIRLFGYCILDNEFHMILENTSGKMADLLKQVNGQFGMLFRRRSGVRGNVFHDRYKSILVQDETYLKMALGHVLDIPVTEGIVDSADEYIWSSIGDYYIKKKSPLLDTGFVHQLFGSKREFRFYLRSDSAKQYPRFLFRTEMYGYILGEESIVDEAIRKNKERIESERLHKSDMPGDRREHFEPVEKVIQDFEKSHNIKIDQLNTHRFSGKRLRSRLLVDLKEKSGLTYPQIKQLPLFMELKAASLGRLYKRAREKMEEKQH